MMSRLVAALAVGAVAACSTPIPDSNPNANRGIGFGSPDQFAAQRAARDAELETGVAPDPDDRAIAQDTINVLNFTSTGGPAPTTGGGGGGAPLAGTGMLANNPSISDEQNFDAVSSRETIESDRDRLQRQRDALEVASPEAVPERPRGTGPNIVAYALSTSNQVGQKIYKRSGGFNEDRYRRACENHGSSDQAQAAFLESGGPVRDRNGLDPDGDGFACRWDPTPFRNARNSG